MSAEIRVQRDPAAGDPLDRVTLNNLFPVSVENQPGPGYRIVTRLVQIPGTVAADALDAGDAMGTAFTIPNVTDAPGQGWELTTAHYLDKSDQAGTVELVLFTEPIVGVANDAAFGPTDDELNNYAGTVSFATYFNFNLNQVSSVTNVGISGKTGATSHLYAQMCTRGTQTITALMPPALILVFKQILG